LKHVFPLRKDENTEAYLMPSLLSSNFRDFEKFEEDLSVYFFYSVYFFHFWCCFFDFRYDAMNDDLFFMKVFCVMIKRSNLLLTMARGSCCDFEYF